MKLADIEGKIPEKIYTVIASEINELRPAQSKSVKQGLLDGESLLVCTPTASGKTLIAELAASNVIFGQGKKVVYIVPLKALASEKYKDFKERYKGIYRVALSIGDWDKADAYLANQDLIIVTSEKLDSLLRHHTPWINDIGLVVVDEIHLLNDPGRGPTLEILITMLRQILEKVQILGLSATIGNPQELADWLEAKLVLDDWRPVELKKGVYLKGVMTFQ